MTNEDRDEYKRQWAGWQRRAEAQRGQIVHAVWRAGHLTCEIAPKSKAPHDLGPEPTPSIRGVGQERLL